MDTVFLRTQEGAQYGPVSLVDLKKWATCGRVRPTDSVSADGRDWMPATELPDLQLVWVVPTDKPALKGPFHASTLLDMLLHEKVSEQTRVHHVSEPIVATVLEVLKDALMREAIADIQGAYAHAFCDVVRRQTGIAPILWPKLSSAVAKEALPADAPTVPNAPAMLPPGHAPLMLQDELQKLSALLAEHQRRFKIALSEWQAARREVVALPSRKQTDQLTACHELEALRAVAEQKNQEQGAVALQISQLIKTRMEIIARLAKNRG